MGLSNRELTKRIVKYLLEGLMVAFAAMVLPSVKLEIQDVIGLALVAAATFGILDIYVPNVNSNVNEITKY